MENNELREFIIFVLVFVALVASYYVFYVAPYHETLNSIMDCMNEIGASDEATYEYCAKEIEGK